MHELCLRVLVTSLSFSFGVGTKVRSKTKNVTIQEKMTQDKNTYTVFQPNHRTITSNMASSSRVAANAEKKANNNANSRNTKLPMAAMTNIEHSVIRHVICNHSTNPFSSTIRTYPFCINIGKEAVQKRIITL